MWNNPISLCGLINVCYVFQQASRQWCLKWESHRIFQGPCTSGTLMSILIRLQSSQTLISAQPERWCVWGEGNNSICSQPGGWRRARERERERWEKSEWMRVTSEWVLSLSPGTNLKLTFWHMKQEGKSHINTTRGAESLKPHVDTVFSEPSLISPHLSRRYRARWRRPIVLDKSLWRM